MTGMEQWRARAFPSLIRLMVFVVFTMGCWWLLAGLSAPLLGALVASSLSLGAAILLTTTVMMRIYEARPLYLVGLFANRAGMEHLGVGLAWGAGASAFVVLAQWAGGWARFERMPEPGAGLSTVGFALAVLLVGSAGEELLFRGYGFQHLIRAFGPWISILSTSGLFAWAHTQNPAFSRVGMVNTALFGMLFGYAYWRTRDLWAPLGMHFGWNFSLATFGANVSGLKIKLTGLSVVPEGSALFSGGAYGPEASLWTTVALLAATSFFWKARLKRQQQGLLAEQEAGHETLEGRSGQPDVAGHGATSSSGRQPDV